MADPSRRSTRFSMRSKQLGQLLIENGDVQSEQVATALEAQEQQGGLLGQILQQQGVCQPQAIAGALLKQVQVTDIKCEELTVRHDVAALIAREFCEAERLCPFELLGSQLLCIIMGNPLNRRAISQIEQGTHFKVKSFKSTWPKINELIQRTYDAAPAEGEAGTEQAQEEFAIDAGGGDAGPSLDIPPPLEEAMAEPEPLQLDAPEQPQVIPEPAPVARSAPAPAQARPAAKRREPSAEIKIKGFENLDESNAEVIETNRRGLSARPRPATADDVAPRPKVAKVAKVDIDLDKLDIHAGVVVKTGGIEDDEQLEEIAHDGVNHPVPLKLVHDSYFYESGKSPIGERSNELHNLVLELTVAETVAQSIGDLREQRAEEAQKTAGKSRVAAAVSVASPANTDRPLELQPCPATVMAAVPIPEIEFQRFVAKLGEDPVGEWDWQFAAAGPIPVSEYEE